MRISWQAQRIVLGEGVDALFEPSPQLARSNKESSRMRSVEERCEGADLRAGELWHHCLEDLDAHLAVNLGKV